ncbi:MAG TPA: divalent-cation tolerance protein CutA [Anaerolineales bacterium]|nr:divalent-cation tolerance protein CutA [Anaerolineales bacterium]
MDNQYIIAFITTPTKEVGEKIANALLDKKLAACVNLISPIRSLYIWNGSTNTDEETLLVVKTRADLFTDQLIPAVKAVHPYEVPEIIALPIVMGSSDYLQWIEAVTSGS